jgi:hypothetical protein
VEARLGGGAQHQHDDHWPTADVLQIRLAAAELVTLAPDVINSQPGFDATPSDPHDTGCELGLGIVACDQQTSEALGFRGSK